MNINPAAITCASSEKNDRGNIQEESIDVKIGKANNLKKAMNAASKQILESKERKMEAEVEQMEEEVAKHAQRYVVEQEANIVIPSAKTHQLEQCDLKTERSLELRRKQQSLQELQSQIHDSVNLLSDATRHSDSLLKYFSKVEIDLSSLEEIESKASEMRELFRSVLQKHIDMKLRISEQQKQIELLSTQRSQNRITIVQAQTEFNRLTAELRSQANEIELRDIEIAKHKDDKSAIMDQNNVLVDQNSVAGTDIDSLNDKLNSHKLRIEEQDKLLSKNTQQIDALTDKNERGQVETKDLHTRYTNLNMKFLNLQVQLEEFDHVHDTERKDFEEKQRHAEVRIVKLETKIGVQNKQLLKSEEKIAALIYDLEKVQSYRKRTKTIDKVSVPYAVHSKVEASVAAHN